MTDDNQNNDAEKNMTNEGSPAAEENTNSGEQSTSTDVAASVEAQNQAAADSTVSDAEAKNVDNGDANAGSAAEEANAGDQEEAKAAPTWDSLKADTKKLIADAQALGVDVSALVAETLGEV